MDGMGGDIPPASIQAAQVPQMQQVQQTQQMQQMHQMQQMQQMQRMQQMTIAEGVAVAGGEVFVSDRLHHRVLVYDAKTLQPVRSFGATWGVDAAHQPLEVVAAGHAQWQPSELHSPEGIAVHGSDVFVADSARRRVAVFERTRGAYLREVGPFDDAVRGVAVVPPGSSPLAHALLLVSAPTRICVRILESGEPWQVIGLEHAGGGICWSPAERRAFVMGTSRIYVLRMHQLGRVRCE
mmetsp:Transcript_80913/g.242355  ORF Transcript_80913/g.242355 Transcript_80913/m.242355 type:complete len:238 (-) Transcript_80913:302-1015(-)